METKENTEMTAKAVSKALAERATSQMKHFKRVYGDITPEKGAMTSKIVMDALENLNQAISYPKCAYGDLATAKQRTQEYFLSCAERQFVPTMEGWAIALGIGRKALYKWLNNENVRCNKEFNEFVLMTRDAIIRPQAWRQSPVLPWLKPQTPQSEPFSQKGSPGHAVPGLPECPVLLTGSFPPQKNNG